MCEIYQIPLVNKNDAYDKICTLFQIANVGNEGYLYLCDDDLMTFSCTKWQLFTEHCLTRFTYCIETKRSYHLHSSKPIGPQQRSSNLCGLTVKVTFNNKDDYPTLL